MPVKMYIDIVSKSLKIQTKATLFNAQQCSMACYFIDQYAWRETVSSTMRKGHQILNPKQLAWNCFGFPFRVRVREKAWLFTRQKPNGRFHLFQNLSDRLERVIDVRFGCLMRK